MKHANEPPETRSRARARKFALEAAVVCGLLAICYARVAVSGHPIPLVICLAAVAILAVIGVTLPDRAIRPEVMGDYEDGRRGAVPDGRDDSDLRRR